MDQIKAQNDKDDYMPQLDGLRAFAVGAVRFITSLSQEGLAV